MLRTALAVFCCLSPCLADGVAGKWDLTATAPSGREFKLELLLKEDAVTLSGTLSSSRGSLALQEVKLEGNLLSCSFDYEGTYRLRLTASSGALKGSYTAPDGATGKVEALRAVAAGGVLGKWKLVARMPGGRERRAVLNLREENGALAGRVETEEGDGAPIRDASFDSGQLSFSVVTDNGTVSLVFKLEGDVLRGTFKGTDVQGEITGAR